MTTTLMDRVKLEIDYLLNEFHDYGTAFLAESLIPNTDYQLQQRLALDEGIREGFWLRARSALSQIPHEARDDELVSLAIAKELIRNGRCSSETLQFIDENISSEWALRQIGESLLSKEQLDVHESRNELSSHVLSDPRYRQRLQEILDMALQFESIVKGGQLSSDKKADVKSFVYCDIYLRILHESQNIDSLTKLSILCSKVEVINQFNSQEISENLLILLEECMGKDASRTVALLQGSGSFARSIQDCVQWSPLGMYKEIKKRVPLGFDFVREYNKRRGETLPEVSSVLDLGCVMQLVTDPNALALPHQNVFTPNMYEPEKLFRLKPTNKLTFDKPIWSIDTDPEGRYLVVGTLGLVYTYERSEGEFVLAEHVPISQAAEQILFHPRKPQFLVCKGGTAVGVTTEGREWNLINYWHTSSYGDVCWHPSRDDYCFIVNDAAKMLYMCTFNSETIVKSWKLPYSPLAISVSGQDVVILTAKTTERPQHLLTVDFESSRITDSKLPLLDNDGMYTTVRCSSWDPRTILLIGPPNCIFLVDKLGERRTRVIYGPKQKQCMLKATFAGPMDKYIIAANEEDKEPQAFIANRFTGDKVGSLVGHEAMVNDVAWAPTNSTSPLLFTASDDHTVLVYQNL